MQLILEVDNIDIERNMSIIEQEPPNEKLITNKITGHLADDIDSGNKENIKKQNNIILDIGHDNVIDSDKEITASGDDILTTNFNNFNGEKLKDETGGTEEIIENENVKTNPEQLCENGDLINKNLNKEESLTTECDAKLEKVKDVDTTEAELKEAIVTEDTELLIPKNPAVDDLATVKKVINADISTELNKGNKSEFDKEIDIPEITNEVKDNNGFELDKEVDISELPAELKFDKEIDVPEISTEVKDNNEFELDNEVDISELSAELNEENAMDIDKEIDIAELSTELNEETAMDLDKEVDIAEVSTKLEEKAMDLDKGVDIAEVPTELKEEKAIDLDKEVDIAEISTESNSESVFEVDETSITVTESKLNESDQNEIPKIDLDEKSDEAECSEVEEKNMAIEIDDENEKKTEKRPESDQNVQEIDENDDVGLSKEIETIQEDNTAKNDTPIEPAQPKRICKLSNNLDIFSDDEEDDLPNIETPKDNSSSTDKQCINIDDDDDIMLIDEDSNTKDNKAKDTSVNLDTNPGSDDSDPVPQNANKPNTEINTCIENRKVNDSIEETLPSEKENKDITEPEKEISDVPTVEKNENAVEKSEEKEKTKKPLLPRNFVKTCKKNLADMTRDDLEEFCILKIVESIVDRSNLGEIKSSLKNLTQTMEECKKKCLMLSKQNKDLQVVLKSVQEEQKSGSDVHITPLKITRSVGMQVVMIADKNNQRKKPINNIQSPIPNNIPKQVKSQTTPSNRNQKEKAVTTQQIPVPRLVPATPPLAKSNQTPPNNTKQANNTALQNGLRVPPSVPKVAEKRGRSQAVTVDLTDDEPPPKLPNIQRGPINQPMRVLTAGPSLISTPRFAQNVNSPRKVYIPISGPQAQNVRPGQTIMLKTLSAMGPRSRAPPPQLTKAPSTPNPMRFGRGQGSRHPAPLPDAMKQYQPPNWKSLPPAPDLKLSKVENGIVISWKIDGYQEDNHEEIASYQLYAYQETSAPPNTALWKKIGDVKALPLPMACTLTQFMAGYKYYFAVRAVDVRSRFGPFSSAGSILLLNKM